MSKTPNTPTPTIITLTLPEPESEGALLIQRGDLAHMSQFSYTTETDFTALIQQALAALAVVESDPPVIPDEPPRKTTTRTVAPPEPPEPMLDIPVKTRKGTTAIPARFVQITGGEADEAAQQQALKVAGRLLDSELWDGKTPIAINDAPAVLRRLDGLTDKIRYRLSSANHHTIKLRSKSGIKITLFNNHRPGNMHKFASTRNASDLVRFAPC